MVFCLISSATYARSYEINVDSQVIGDAEIVTSKHEDTLYSLALQYKLGVAALVDANRDVDPRLPGEGTELRLPSRHILPFDILHFVSHSGIIINLPEMRMYYFSSKEKKVYVYPVGIGRQGWETPLLESTVSNVTENPVWTPPASIHREYSNAGLSLPDTIPAGEDNPLGQYAIRIGQTNYLIHGTNKPEGVGLRVSHGCIRLYAEHIAELVSMISVGTPVAIVNQPIKLGRRHGKLYLQAYRPVAGAAYNSSTALGGFIKYAESALSAAELARVKRHIQSAIDKGDFYSGLPTLVAQ